VVLPSQDPPGQRQPQQQLANPGLVQQPHAHSFAKWALQGIQRRAFELCCPCMATAAAL
jgi:hypothetical protein